MNVKSKMTTVSAVALLVSGCSSLNDPATSLFAPTATKNLETACTGAGSRPAGLNYPKADSMPPSDWAESASQIPTDIREARGHAIRYLQCYVARVEAESVRNDVYSIPIIGAAIATVATGAFNSGKTATAAASVTGGGLELLQVYDHPDTDETTDLAVVQGLQCVIDETQPLNKDYRAPLERYIAVLEQAQLEVEDDEASQQAIN